MDPRPVVVLLHGALGCGEDWGAVEAALAPTCRVFVPDLLGGEAGLPVHDPLRYGVGDEAESMLMRIGARVPPHARVHLVGHDYGAVVALEMARRHPERIASLVLHEPTRFDLLVEGFDRDFVASLQRPVELLVARGLVAGAARMYHDFWHGPGKFDALDECRRDRLSALAAKLVLELRAMTEPPAGPMGEAASRVRTTLVAGTQSFQITRRMVERLAGQLRNASLTWIDGDHLSPLTEPEKFVAVLRRVLPGVERIAA